MVCQVKFAEWTRDERLRQPVFLGLREDKDAKELVRESFMSMATNPARWWVKDEGLRG